MLIFLLSRAQSGIILNVQHQLEDILSNQHLIVRNQNDMFSKLTDIEKRLTNVETCLIVQQQQQQQQQMQYQPTTSSRAGLPPSGT